MKLNKSPYRGTRDFFPEEKRIRDYLFSVMTKTAESFSYESYDGPLLEEIELYKAKSGEELINEQIYSFTDRGERIVAIRPEMTPTLARMVSQIHKEASKPLRWFSIPNVLRYERPQKGRVREHWQLNCDLFGAPEKQGEIEILQLVIELLNNYGANESHFEILINDRVIVDLVFNTLMNCTQEQTYKLYKIVDKAKKISDEALRKMVSEVQLNSISENIFYSYLQLSSIQNVIDFLNSNNQSNLADKFNHFFKICEEVEIFKYLKFDPTIVRGLDYYTGIVFEVFDKHPDNKRALCGGGAYANLLQIFGETPLSGVGFGLGDVTLKDFLEVHNLLPSFKYANHDILLTSQEENGITQLQLLGKALRKNNFSTMMNLESIKTKKAFQLAEKKNINFIITRSIEEIENNEIQIKNLKMQTFKVFKINEIQNIIQFIKE